MIKQALQALIVTMALIATIGCQEQKLDHPAAGSWNASMISAGVVVNIGTVKIGADNIELKNSNIHREQLSLQINGSNLRFTDPNDSSFYAEVRAIGDTMASMRMQGINGLVDLKRDS